MNNKHLFPKIIGLLFLLINVSGCLLAAGGAGAEVGYVALQEDRTTGEVIDDQFIVTSIKTQLLASPEVSGLNLNVDSHKGVVTLRGFTQTQNESDKAIAIASSVKGVTEVISKLTIQN